MCGIFGYMGKKNAVDVCIKGLKLLEYRGYDSSGIAGVKEGQILCCKEVGKIDALERATLQMQFDVPVAIAHTRWATHGKPSKENAHPHFDQFKTVAVVHNGIIENYAALRKQLVENNKVDFSSETDTEVIAQLIGHLYEGDLFVAAKRAFLFLEGSFAIAIIHQKHPDEVIVSAKESPLVVGFAPDSKEIFVASDPNAMAGQKIETFFLTNGEIGVLKAGHPPQFFDRQGNEIIKTAILQEIKEGAIGKGQFEHFMLKEIFEQPAVVLNALRDRINLPEGMIIFEEIKFDLKEYLDVRHIIIVACGTSYHAAFVCSYMLEEIAGISAKAEIASEFRYKHPIVLEKTLVIALSQSGETADTLAAMREAKSKGARVLALCNVPGSTLTREAEVTLLLHAGPEIAVASTKTFISQICVLYLFVILMARLRHMSKEDGRIFLKHLYELPEQIQEILEKAGEIEKLAKKYAHYEDFFFLGRSYLYPAALEAALKLKEIAYINAVGYPAGEMKHGPIALLGESVPVVIVCANEALQSKTMSNLMECKARKAPIIVLGWKEFEKDITAVADDVLWLPKTSDPLACIPVTIATQLFAYYMAKERGAAIDQPRNLAKSITVE
jgi:glutamine---fructose-6-phosphate transaminase (isomerizing)